MAYQKSAKDLAWDRERTNLRHEAEEWRDKYIKSQVIVSTQEQKMLTYEIENQELRDAIVKLTNGKATPDEILTNMRKESELKDMLSILCDHSILNKYI